MRHRAVRISPGFIFVGACQEARRLGAQFFCSLDRCPTQAHTRGRQDVAIGYAVLKHLSFSSSSAPVPGAWSVPPCIGSDIWNLPVAASRAAARCYSSFRRSPVPDGVCRVGHCAGPHEESIQPALHAGRPDRRAAFTLTRYPSSTARVAKAEGRRSPVGPSADSELDEGPASPEGRGIASTGCHVLVLGTFPFCQGLLPALPSFSFGLPGLVGLGGSLAGFPDLEGRVADDRLPDIARRAACYGGSWPVRPAGAGPQPPL